MVHLDLYTKEDFTFKHYRKSSKTFIKAFYSLQTRILKSFL